MAKQVQFKYILGLDCETSGIITKSKNPAVDESNPDRYAQAVSWGFIILDAVTLEEIDSLYVEIKWDGSSVWNKGAEKIHGLSKEHLDKNGLTEEQAVLEIGSWIMKYFGTDPMTPLGHNVHFDIKFFYAMMERHGLHFRFSNRVIDTMGFALILAKSFNSDQLFDTVGLDQRQEHNALEDIRFTVEAARRLRAVFQHGLDNI